MELVQLLGYELNGKKGGGIRKRFVVSLK